MSSSAKPPATTVTPEDRALCADAVAAAANAYAPYSGLKIGAAVRTASGTVFSGANFENAAYGVGTCAEVAAVTAANSAGDRNIEAIAVAGVDRAVVTPCGRCRQVILEAAHVADRDIRVICGNGNLSEVRTYVISELLPDAFGPASLGRPAGPQVPK